MCHPQHGASAALEADIRPTPPPDPGLDFKVKFSVPWKSVWVGNSTGCRVISLARDSQAPRHHAEAGYLPSSLLLLVPWTCLACRLKMLPAFATRAASGVSAVRGAAAAASAASRSLHISVAVKACLTRCCAVQHGRPRCQAGLRARVQCRRLAPAQSVLRFSTPLPLLFSVYNRRAPGLAGPQSPLSWMQMPTGRQVTTPPIPAPTRCSGA